MKTIRDVILVLRLSLTFGYKEKAIPLLNWDLIEYPKEIGIHRVVSLSKEDEQQLIQCIYLHLNRKTAGILVALMTGVRIGELCGLQMSDISLTDHLEEVLDQMDLIEPIPEGKRIKNVAAMMFSERPDYFFRQAQVDIVLFPEGRENNPNNLIEVEPIKGSVPTMIKETLSYLRTNVIKKQIVKPKDRAES